jgi:hypothetical protein
MKTLTIALVAAMGTLNAKADPRASVSGKKIKLVKQDMVQTSIGDCASQDCATCARSLSIYAFDEAGKLRLVFTDLEVREKDGTWLPHVRTAFVVGGREVESNYGNQYPTDGEALESALFLMDEDKPKCPVTITIDANSKVINAKTPCHEHGT